jgi:hypothetical protein
MREGVRMKRIAVFVIGGVLLFEPGCSNPRKLVLKEQNKESVLKTVGDSKKLSEDDRKALNAYLMRIEFRRLVAAEDEKTKRLAREEILKAAGKSANLSEDNKKALMAFFELTYKGLGLDLQGSCCPAPAYGKTVGEMIEEQKKWQTEQQARFDGLERVAIEADAKQEALAAELRKALPFTVFSKFQAEFGKLKDYILIKGACENTSGKNIRAFEGQILFTDLSGVQIISLGVPMSGPIEAGKTLMLTFRIKYNQSLPSHTKLKKTDLKEMKVVWNPSAILFEDGTRLSSGGH